MNKRWTTAAVIGLAVAIAGYFVWQNQTRSALPEGIAKSNGRIEAGQVQIAAKYSGRVSEILVDEERHGRQGPGRRPHGGGRTRSRSSTPAEAQVRRAEKSLLEATARVDQRQSELIYAEQEMKRTQGVYDEGYATAEKLDQRRTALRTAVAALQASQAGVEEAKATIESGQGRRPPDQIASRRNRAQCAEARPNSVPSGRTR